MYEVGTVIAAAAALLLWLFAIDYSRVRWWDHPGGRLVMVVLVSLAAVLTLAACRNLFGDFPGHTLARVLVYGGAFVAIGWAWLLHRRVNRPKHRAPR